MIMVVGVLDCVGAALMVLALFGKNTDMGDAIPASLWAAVLALSAVVILGGAS